MDEGETDGLTTDTLLGGRLRLVQTRAGHRAGTDAVLLAAAAPIEAEGRFLDVGAGTGAAGLTLALRCPSARGFLLEVDPGTAALARRNCCLNGLSGRISVAEADLFTAASCHAAGVLAEDASLVVTNPPYYLGGAVRASPDPSRAAAYVLPGKGHGDWLVRAAACLAPHGRLVLIHRPEALPALLEACAGRIGAVTVRPVQARADTSAIRILLSGIKGSRAPLRIAPAFVLHRADGVFTAQAEAMHRGDALTAM